MDSCSKCGSPIHWDDVTCPECGEEHPHIDADEVEPPTTGNLIADILFLGFPSDRGIALAGAAVAVVFGASKLWILAAITVVVAALILIFFSLRRRRR